MQCFGHHDLTTTYSLLFLPACLFARSLSCLLLSLLFLLLVVVCAFVGSCGGSCGCDRWFILRWLLILVVVAAAVGGS